MSDAAAALKAARLRLYQDFPFYAAHAIRIRTKDATITSLVLNAGQEVLFRAMEHQWQTEGKVRIVVLKGRQMGASTMIGAWLYWRASQHKAQKAFVIAHKAEATSTLFDMTKRFHDLCPPLLKPSTKYAGRRELSFDLLQSSYGVATAGGDDVGRSETLTMVHASEVAFWPPISAKKNWNGLTKTVPNRKGTAIVVESTANGVTGVFHDIWQGAIEGTNGFIPVFLAWFLMPEYRDEVPKGFKRTPDEEVLVKRFGLDDEQLCFRRREIALTSLDQFRQEYPCFADEAFLTTGMPVFNPEQIMAQVQTTRRPPDALYALEGTLFAENVRGNLLEYHPLDPAETYYIGADVAFGVRGGDYSVAQVLDSQKRQVAVYRAHVHPDFYADILNALALRYNTAKLVVEVNNHGLLPNSRLAKDFSYPNLYLRETVDTLTEEVKEQPGFDTNAATKPLIIDQLRAALREEEMTLHDRQTLAELLTYIVTPTGKMQAEAGHFDDCVMALVSTAVEFQASVAE